MWLNISYSSLLKLFLKKWLEKSPMKKVAYSIAKTTTNIIMNNNIDFILTSKKKVDFEGVNKKKTFLLWPL